MGFLQGEGWKLKIRVILGSGRRYLMIVESVFQMGSALGAHSSATLAENFGCAWTRECVGRGGPFHLRKRLTLPKRRLNRALLSSIIPTRGLHDSRILEGRPLCPTKISNNVWM